MQLPWLEWYTEGDGEEREMKRQREGKTGERERERETEGKTERERGGMWRDKRGKKERKEKNREQTFGVKIYRTCAGSNITIKLYTK